MRVPVRFVETGINVLPELASGSIIITLAETVDEIIEEMKRLTRKGWELYEEHQKTSKSSSD
jgi:hypothetical protein